MTASTLNTDRQACFQFKASFVPCAILQLNRYDLDALEIHLVETIRRAPNFFIGSPVLVDLEKVKELGTLDFAKIKQILISHALAPIGVRGGSEEQLQAATSAGLPVVNIGKSTFNDSSKEKVDEKIEDKVDEKVDDKMSTTKLITTPIRSGVQVYARGGDLIVVAHVSPGAELLADGNIHVYGALRGRALAGVQGNTNARIFCHTLEAELVSIAGFYLTKEDMQLLPEKQELIQIYLEEEKVRIKGIRN
jgi:septum site-determining protein MinC